MKKRVLLLNWAVIALLLVPASMTAQRTVEATDTLDVEELTDDSPSVTQYELKECDWVDICTGNPKYAIVTKDGKNGIYDMELHRNITEIVYRDLGFSKQVVAEDSTFISLFYATRGIKCGIINVYEPSNLVMAIWMDDPDEVYSLDECTSLDKKMMKRAKKQLESFIQQHQLDNVQIVILDARSGHLKTWIALDANMGKENAGKLLAHSCTGSLTKPFHTIMALENKQMSLDSIYNGISYRKGIKKVDNVVMHQAIMNGYRRSIAERKWRKLTDSRNPSTCPLAVAVGYNSLVHNGKMIIPTMKADSVEVKENVFTESCLSNLRDVLTVNRDESPQLAWLPTETDWLAYATSANLYADDDKEMSMALGKQIQFAGVFPIENPKYTICVVADKYSLDVTPSAFKDVVDPMVRWLLKRKMTKM